MEDCAPESPGNTGGLGLAPQGSLRPHPHPPSQTQPGPEEGLLRSSGQMEISGCTGRYPQRQLPSGFLATPTFLHGRFLWIWRGRGRGVGGYTAQPTPPLTQPPRAAPRAEQRWRGPEPAVVWVGLQWVNVPNPFPFPLHSKKYCLLQATSKWPESLPQAALTCPRTLHRSCVLFLRLCLHQKPSLDHKGPPGEAPGEAAPSGSLPPST